MEVAVGTRHHHLVARLQGEDVAGTDTGRHILESYLGTRLERRRGNTHRQGDDVALGGVVGHGVGADRGLGVVSLQREDVEVLPGCDIVLADVVLVEVLVVVDAVVGRDLDLGVGTREEVHVLARGQGHLELLDEGGDVLVGKHGALPLLDAHHRLGHLDTHVALDLALATQAPVLLDLLAREVGTLGVEDLATTAEHLQLALSAAGLSATSGGQVDAVLVERGHDARSLIDVQLLVAIDRDGHFSARAKKLLGQEQDDNQQEYYRKEHSYTADNEIDIHTVILNFKS